jgi:hypothetical protein
MAAIANAIDFVVESMSSKKTETAAISSTAGLKPLLIGLYGLGFFFNCVMSDYSEVPGLPMFSFVYFFGSTLQLLGLVALAMRVKATKSVTGISSQSLVMYSLSLTARVVVTSIYDGYLPADNTGDYWIQIVDTCSLVVVIGLLFMLHKRFVHTYQEEHDRMSILPMVSAAAILASFVHADLNRSWLFDSMWAFSVNVEALQMIPQLTMLSKVGGLVDSVTAHFVVLTCMASVCRLAFWVWAVAGSSELSAGDGESLSGMLWGGYYVLGAYSVEVLIHLDFLFYCVKSWMKGNKNVALPKMEVGE